jgi:membrane protein DedA with SNARE-associated domain
MADAVIRFVSGADGLLLGFIVFAVVLGESLVITDFVVPGEVGLVIAGAAAAENGTPLGLVVGAASCGAIAGDAAGYFGGRVFGTDLIEHKRWLRRLRRPLRRARDAFERRGRTIVAFSRWVGALRGITPVVAGSARLPAPDFFAADVPSAIAWSLALASVGNFWGDDAAAVIDRAEVGISIAVVLIAVVSVVWWRRSRRSASSRRRPA